ncbi:DMT family transporter [Vibrio ostreae]|uniref:DMT family transporter n=1 Tax=Vibrio ostreae TaxID=2841925 RepID=A0A975UAV0_9VIBR|nr:DMT family transporter [Vibrio ostreae]QXO18247.1 DMT family transporter [Vibrio ostreae]
MKVRNYSVLFIIGGIWGSQFIFQQQALSLFSPLWIATLRALFGALTLIILCKCSGLKSKNKQWGLFCIIGLLEAVIPFILVPWGQIQLSSATTAVLMGTVPFCTLLLAPLLIRGSTIGVYSLLSVVMGFGGLLLLFYPALSSQDQTIPLTSAGAILLAAACFAIALLLLNRVRDEHPLMVARNVLIMASLQLTALTLLEAPTELASLHFNQLSVFNVFSVIYLGVMCAGVVYYLYMISVKNAGAVFTSMTNYLVPSFGVVFGLIFSDEMLPLTTWLALAVILLALLLNQMPSRTKQS